MAADNFQASFLLESLANDFLPGLPNPALIERLQYELAIRRSEEDYKLEKKNIDLNITYEPYTKADSQEDSCTICLVEFEDGDEVCDIECKHLFHKDCIVEWGKVKPECAICRKEIPHTINEMPTTNNQEEQENITTDNNDIHNFYYPTQRHRIYPLGQIDPITTGEIIGMALMRMTQDLYAQYNVDYDSDETLPDLELDDTIIPDDPPNLENQAPAEAPAEDYIPAETSGVNSMTQNQFYIPLQFFFNDIYYDDSQRTDEFTDPESRPS